MDPQQNILDQLKPNHLPETVSIWPIAYGWWIAISVALIVLTILIFWSLSYYKKNKYRRRALATARVIANHYKINNDIKIFTSECNKLLKQVVLSAFPRHQVAVLHGKSWSNFLKNHCSPCQHTDKAVYLLGENHYKPVSDDRVTCLYPFVCHWIKKHHV